MNKENTTFEETVIIESMGNEGEGVARIPSGQVVFVDGVLPGEHLRVAVEASTKKFTRATVIERLSDSSERITPVCSSYERCGGCNLMHISYERELVYKRQKVFDCLTRIGGFDPDFIESVLQHTVRNDNITHYRNHMQYTIGSDSVSGCPKIGFKASSSNDFTEIDECFTEYRIFGKIREYMSERFKDYPVKLFEQMVLRGSERTKQILIEFTVVSTLPHEVIIRDARVYLKEAALKAFVSGEGYILKGLVLQICKDRTSLKRRNGKRVVIDGEGYYEEILSGHTFRVNSGAFFQVNTEQAEKLYGLAREGLEGAEVIYDLYCGAGTIGLTTVGPNQKLYGIEISPEAVAAAKVNARLSGNENAVFVCKPCEKVILGKADIPFPDAVITDPPRKGMDFSFVNQLIKLGAPRISYVSCDPATMARDLKFLCAAYKIEKITPVDMFSRSSHVECVVLMSRKPK